MVLVFFSPLPLIGQKDQPAVHQVAVKTQLNLSFFINKQVKCVVVGSLVTTHRSFKGLLLLSRSPLAKPIINPSHSDFCPRDVRVASESAVSPAATREMTKGAFESHEFGKLFFHVVF